MSSSGMGGTNSSSNSNGSSNSGYNSAPVGHGQNQNNTGNAEEPTSSVDDDSENWSDLDEEEDADDILPESESESDLSDEDTEARRHVQRSRDEEDQLRYSSSSPAQSLLQCQPEWDHWVRTGSVKSAEDNGETFDGVMGNVSFVRQGRVYTFGGLNKEISVRWLANINHNQWLRDPAQGRALFASAALPLTGDAGWDRVDDGTEYLYIPSESTAIEHDRVPPPQSTAGAGAAPTAPAATAVDAEDGSSSSNPTGSSAGGGGSAALPPPRTISAAPLPPDLNQLMTLLLGTASTDVVLLNTLAEAIGFDTKTPWDRQRASAIGERNSPFYGIGLTVKPKRMPHGALGPPLSSTHLSRPPHIEGHVGFYYPKQDSFEFFSGAYSQQGAQLWSKLNPWYTQGTAALGIRGRYNFTTKRWSMVKGTPYLPYCPCAAVHEASGMTFLYGGFNRNRNKDEHFRVCRWEDPAFGTNDVPEQLGKYLTSAVQWTGTPPLSLMKGCGAMVGDYFYLWGGFGRERKNDEDKDFLGSHLNVAYIGGVVEAYSKLPIPPYRMGEGPTEAQTKAVDGSQLPTVFWRTIDLSLMGTSPMRYPLRRSRPTMISLPHQNGLVIFGGMYEQDYRCDDLLFIDLAYLGGGGGGEDQDKLTKSQKRNKQHRCFVYPLDSAWRTEIRKKEEVQLAITRQAHRMKQPALMTVLEEDQTLAHPELEEGSSSNVVGPSQQKKDEEEDEGEEAKSPLLLHGGMSTTSETLVHNTPAMYHPELAVLKKYSDDGCPSPIFKGSYPPEMSSTCLVWLGPGYENMFAVIGGGASNQRVGFPENCVFTSKLAPPSLRRQIARALARRLAESEVK